MLWGYVDMFFKPLNSKNLMKLKETELQFA